MKIIRHLLAFISLMEGRVASSGEKEHELDLDSHGKETPGQSMIKYPVKNDHKSIERGRKSYLIYCSSCHGEKGKVIAHFDRKGPLGHRKFYENTAEEHLAA